MMKTILALAMVGVAASATAQPLPQQVNPQTQALWDRAVQEMNSNVVCNGIVIDLRNKVADLTAKLADAEKRAKKPKAAPDEK